MRVPLLATCVAALSCGLVSPHQSVASTVPIPQGQNAQTQLAQTHLTQTQLTQMHLTQMQTNQSASGLEGLDSTADQQSDDKNTSAEPLRMPEFDGVVHTLVVLDDLAVVGGEFSGCRNADESSWTACQNLALVDIVTGRLMPDFQVKTDGAVRDVGFSADRRSLYLVGDFQRVNGNDSRYIAKVAVPTGKVELEFTANTDAPITAIAVNDSDVVVGGQFGKANDQPRRGLAMFAAQSGELREWQAAVEGVVDDVALHPNTRSVVVGGDLQSVAGKSSTGVAKVDARSGRRQFFAFEETLRKRGIKARISKVVAQDDHVVLSAASDSPGFRGVAKVSLARGETLWVNDCQDVVRDVASDAERVVFAGVRRACPAVIDTPHGGDIDVAVWAVSSRPSPYQRVNSFGVFEDTLASEPVHWKPRMRDSAGKAVSLDAQAIALAAGAVLAVGSKRDDQGRLLSCLYFYPRIGAGRVKRAGFDRSVSLDPAFTVSGGAVVAAVRGLFDSDSTIIRYDLMRGGTNVASAVSVDNSWWSRANPVLIDPRPRAGKHRYSVVATTEDGQRIQTKPELVKVAEARSQCQHITAKRTSAFWVAQASPNGVVADCVQGEGLDTTNVPHQTQPDRWVFPDEEPRLLVAQQATVLPTSYAFSVTFKTTRKDVVLLSHGSRRDGPSAVVDAALFVDGEGHLAAIDGYRRPVARTTGVWNDGQWHRAVVVVDEKRLRIWVDGTAQVDIARKPQPTGKGRGYWRVGGDRIGSPSQPWPSRAFSGEVRDFGYWTGIFDTPRLADLAKRPDL